MEVVWKFPSAMEKARRRARDFQRLTPDQRLREIAALMAFGSTMVHSNPRRAAIEKKMLADEQRWRQIQHELFARYAK